MTDKDLVCAPLTVIFAHFFFSLLLLSLNKFASSVTRLHVGLDELSVLRPLILLFQFISVQFISLSTKLSSRLPDSVHQFHCCFFFSCRALRAGAAGGAKRDANVFGKKIKTKPVATSFRSLPSSQPTPPPSNPPADLLTTCNQSSCLTRPAIFLVLFLVLSLLFC